MRPFLPILLPIVAATLLVAAGSTVARAQTHVGAQHDQGVHWAVAAPQGASWSLACRFPPVTMEMSNYDRAHWANGLTRTGRGPMAGRLPVDNGYCTLTKTGGPGAVAIAMVRNGEIQARGTIDPARPASVGFL
tara:strand:+ start:321 stop:722 length:402 start_codon:yes stop_codon:yes gene_type:complete